MAAVGTATGESYTTSGVSEIEAALDSGDKKGNKAAELIYYPQSQILDFIRSRFGDSITKLEEYPNGATLTELATGDPDVSAWIVSPADPWQRSDEPGKRSLREFYVVEQNHSPEMAMQAAKPEIEKILTQSSDSETGRDKLGGEIEGHMVMAGDLDRTLPSVTRNVFQEERVEMSDQQREFALRPASGMRNLLALYKKELQAIIAQANELGVLFNTGSFNSGMVHLGELEFNDHPYVAKVVAAINEQKVVPHLDSYNGRFRASVEPVISTISGGKTIAEVVNDPRYGIVIWQTNSAHASIPTPTDESGRTFDSLLLDEGNLYSYFETEMNLICYTGPHMFGEEITINGKRVLDAREPIRGLFSSANPTSVFPTADLNLSEVQKAAVISGGSNIPDRAGGLICMSGEDGVNIDTGTHGAFRPRDSINSEQFFNPEKRAEANSRKRVEYTGRPSTPDLRKLMQSFALQKVLHYTSLLAHAEGFTDSYDWLRANGIDLQDYYEYQTPKAIIAREESVLGNYDVVKLSNFQKIVTLVERKFNDQSENFGEKVDFDFSVFDYADEGIDSVLNSVDKSVSIDPEYMKLEGFGKFEFYLDNPERFASYGEFVAGLSRKELEDLLIVDGYFSNVYKEEDIRSANIGNLVFLLNHMVADYTSRLAA